MNDLTGQTFARLTVVGYAGKRGRYHAWRCRCECGGTKDVIGTNLTSGNVRSCGCLRSEVRRAAWTKHGQSRSNAGAPSPTFVSWQRMIQRCHYPKSPRYSWYGGRGIRVCDRWRESFETFLADMGERPAGLTLDRIDSDGNYEPGNCRWATPKQQAANRRRAA